MSSFRPVGLGLGAGRLTGRRAAAVAAPQAPNDHLDVYTGTISPGQIADIVALGVDRHEPEVASVPGERGQKAQVRVETS